MTAAASTPLLPLPPPSPPLIPNTLTVYRNRDLRIRNHAHPSASGPHRPPPRIPPRLRSCHSIRGPFLWNQDSSLRKGSISCIYSKGKIMGSDSHVEHVEHFSCLPLGSSRLAVFRLPSYKECVSQPWSGDKGGDEVEKEVEGAANRKEDLERNGDQSSKRDGRKATKGDTDVPSIGPLLSHPIDS
ncbi:uncharacterized protein BKCO1_37000196 [Diplodia corticola]|uniref:Uncharacterized protein n=1 Tax=Diplodia corticola TaxID=236234 RepID=A0A1J9QVU4_9PEZI|nr:uncharacterized protein BKCO1_37000196 [Diplodia corticola]OJD32497.1 hypothetical protein BKCO1_37000196 [Diplodia corticola]